MQLDNYAGYKEERRVQMRIDGDDWDITTSVGSTALGVAALRALASHEENPLIVDPYAQLFVAETSSNIFGVGLPDDTKNTESSTTLPFTPFLEWMLTFIKVRTKIIDDALTAAVERGIDQVVILAAGLDTRAYRLAVLQGVHVFEIDREQVLKFKHHILNTHNVHPIHKRTPIVADLRENWKEKLVEAGFNPSRPTCWITEGLLPYLPPEAQYGIAEVINHNSPVGSRWIVEISNDEVYKRYVDLPWKLPHQFDVTTLWYSRDLPSSRDLVSTWEVEEKLISDYVSEDSIQVHTQQEKDFLHYAFHSTGYYIADKLTDIIE